MRGGILCCLSSYHCCIYGTDFPIYGRTNACGGVSWHTRRRKAHFHLHIKVEIWLMPFKSYQAINNQFSHLDLGVKHMLLVCQFTFASPAIPPTCASLPHSQMLYLLNQGWWPKPLFSLLQGLLSVILKVRFSFVKHSLYGACMCKT